MRNTDIYNLVEEKKSELKKLWYNTSAENMEDLINWFIKIANSMMTDEMEKIDNIELNTIIFNNIDNDEINLFKPIDIKFNKGLNSENNNIESCEDDEYSESKNRLFEMNKKLDLFNQNITNDEILKFIKKEDSRLTLSKKDIANLVKILKKKKQILKEFNEWKLSKIQEDLLIELWYQYNLK